MHADVRAYLVLAMVEMAISVTHTSWSNQGFIPSGSGRGRVQRLLHRDFVAIWEQLHC